MIRELTQAEDRILAMIRAHYGPQNTVESISWSDNAEATLWVEDTTGAVILMANLTNLADWRLAGTIASDEELRRDWLQIMDTNPGGLLE